MRRTGPIAALCGALLLNVRPAVAQTDPLAQAKSLFNAGAQAYERAQYVSAIQAFEEAYRLTPRPGILFSIAQAERRQYYIDKNPERVRKAISLYHEYLAAVPEGGRRSDVVQALAELEPIAARLEAPAAGPAPAAPVKKVTGLTISSQVEDAVVSVDGGPPKKVPFIGEVAPGNHRFKVTAPGFIEHEREIAVAEGSVVPIDVELEERPALLVVDTEARAQISVDGRLLGEAPLARPIELPSGRHLVAVLKSGRKPFSREVELARGERIKVTADLERTTQRYFSYALVGTGIAGVLVGGVFGIVALSEQGRAQEIRDAARDQGNVAFGQRQEYLDAVDGRTTWRQAATVAAGIGAALGAGGVLLYLTDVPSVGAPGMERRDGPAPQRPKRGEPSMEVTASPVLGPGITGAVLEGRF